MEQDLTGTRGRWLGPSDRLAGFVLSGERVAEKQAMIKALGEAEG